MAIPLKYNTASQEFTFGQALDNTDGDAEEGGLTIANTDIKLHKAGTITLASKNSGGATYISNGVYYGTFDATDTNTYGPMTMYIHVAGALAMKVEFEVMNAVAYDALYGTDNFDVNVTQLGGVTQSATDLKDFADAGYDPATNKVQGVVLVDTNTDMRGTDSAAIAGDAMTLTAAATSAQLVDDILDEAISGSAHATLGSLGNRIYLGQSNSWTSSTVNDASATTTVFITNLTSSVDDFYKDQSCFFVTGALAGQSRIIQAYNGTTKAITLSEALTSAPANGVVFALGTLHVHSESELANAVRAEMDSNSTQLSAILAMLDDPRAEPGQGAPAVNADLATKIDYLYKFLRNKTEQTATTMSIYNDAGTVVDHKASVSDDATTATKSEVISGA